MRGLHRSVAVHDAFGRRFVGWRTAASTPTQLRWTRWR